MMGGPNSPLPPPPRAGEEHHPWSPSQGHKQLCSAASSAEEAAKKAGLLLEKFPEAAEEGTNLHTYLDPSKSLDGLDGEARWAVERAREYITQETDWSSLVFYENTLVAGIEEQLYFGTCDVVAMPNGDSPPPVVVDIKFGREPLIDDLVRIQMEGYAGALFPAWDTAEVRVYQPRTKTEFRERYDNLGAIFARVKARIEYAQAHPDEYRYGPWCKVCRASAVCPEFAKQGNGALLPAKPEPNGLTLAQQKRWDDFWRLVKPAGEAWEKRKKAMTDAELDALGYERKVRRMPILKSERTGEFKEVTYLSRKNGGDDQ